MKKIKRYTDSEKLMEKSPAKFWEEAFPIGNGSKGAVVFGGTDKETLCLNDDTLWSGYPADNFKGEVEKSLDKAKELVRAGKYAEADKELSENFACQVSQSYMPLGNIEIEFGSGKVSKYKRVLDLAKAVVKTEYMKNGVQYKSISFASSPADAIIYRMDSSDTNGLPKQAICADINFISPLYSKTYTERNVLCLEGECPANEDGRKAIYFDTPEKRGIRFIAMAEIKTDGVLKDKQNSFQIKNASFIEVRITDTTSYNGYKKHPFTDGKDYKTDCQKLQNSVSEMEFQQLLKEHIKDFSKYFSRVYIDLGSNGKSKTPTKDRLIRYANGEEDKALPALMFNFGRYLTISASRKGSEAMNLQGIWNRHFMPPWRSSYTVNINTEMNYFPTLAVGLKEMYEPLIRLIKEVAEKGEETARRLYGAEGWCCHHNTDIWRHTIPSSGQASWMFWNGAGGWFCHHLMEYYEYTLDKNFLKKTAYPIMTGAVKFYLSQLETMDGHRIILPSTSPENIFWCENGTSAVSETTEMTMAIVRELFKNYVKTCQILEIESETLSQVKAELPLLMPITVGVDGRILEWYGEKPEAAIHHRHISHLYALHPGNEITLEKTPELIEPCRKVLQVRGDEGTGWSLAWKCNFYTRLRDGNRAFELIKRQLTLKEPSDEEAVEGGGTYPNMFCSHPPFQIDGNLGAVSGIAEMFLQSSVDVLHIIPALPCEFKNVGIKGLKAKGNRTVTLTVRGGKLVYCKVKGSVPSYITVCGINFAAEFKPTKDGCVYELK